MQELSFHTCDDAYRNRLTFLKRLRDMPPAEARSIIGAAVHPSVGLIDEREAWLLLLVFAPEIIG